MAQRDLQQLRSAVDEASRGKIYIKTIDEARVRARFDDAELRLRCDCFDEKTEEK